MRFLKNNHFNINLKESILQEVKKDVEKCKQYLKTDSTYLTEHKLDKKVI